MSAVGKPYVSNDEIRIPYQISEKGRVDIYQVINVHNEHEMTCWGVEFLPKVNEIAVKINGMHLEKGILRLNIIVKGRNLEGIRLNVGKLIDKEKINELA